MRDSEPVRVQTWDELGATCRGARAPSAASSRRCSASLPSAERVCVAGPRLPAHQFRSRRARGLGSGSRYLPAEDLEHFGVSVDQIERRELTPGFERLVALEVERARSLFRVSEPAADTVAPRVRPGMRLARSVYLGVLDRTERLDFDVLGRSPRLPPWELAQAVVGALRSSA